MSVTRVKICGIKSVEDARLAVEFGADAIGLLVGQLHNSPDFITPEQAKHIVGEMPPFVSTVLVTHLHDREKIAELVTDVCPSTLQLHGKSRPADTRFLRQQFPQLKISKALHANAEGVEDEAETWVKYVDAILLDTSSPETDQVGGTGRTHDWAVSAHMVGTLRKPVILAGGLTPGNVANAIAKVRPFAVDVNSGIKNAAGFKDPEKLRRFIEIAHLAGDYTGTSNLQQAAC
jgi:phosphoribosylanthranilate isomerase